MAESLRKVTNPVKYKPHYDSIIKAEFTEATIKLTLDNTAAQHCKVSYIYNGIRYYDEITYVRKNAKIQICVECDEGYVVKFVHVGTSKYLPSILDETVTIKTDCKIYVEEEIRSYYANFKAGYNTTLSYHFINGSVEVIHTLGPGESESYRVDYGTEIDVAYTVDTGYNGELRKSDVKTTDTHFVVGAEDLWISTYASKKVFTVHMYYPDEAKLEVSYTDDDGVTHTYQTGELADPTQITEYFDAVYGSKLKIVVTVNLGTIISHIYINNTLDVPNYTVYTLDSDISIRTIVGIKYQYVKVLASDTINNVVLYHGQRYDHRSGTFAVRYSDYIYFDMTPKDSFQHYVKAVKINNTEYPGLESYQVLEDLNVDSVAGDNVYKKYKVTLSSVLHGTIYIFYIDTDYTENDSPVDVMENYTIKIWMEPYPGYRNLALYVNGMEIPHDKVVDYRVTQDITITGQTQLII